VNTTGRQLAGPALLTCLLIFPIAGHPEDTYLDAISVEVEKLDGGTPGGGDSAESRSAANADDPLAKFEQELETRYRGTYLFYKKLPTKSQEEVFHEYQEGAPIEEARKTIMNRYLHSR
jgi:hypothetical protein